MPADIFARVHGIRDDQGDSRIAYGDDFAISQIWPAGERYRSAYGMLLMQLTEGFPMDPLDFDEVAVRRVAEEYGLKFIDLKSPNIVENFRAALDAMIDFDQEVAPLQWRNRWPSVQAIGIPRSRRKQFRSLRRAIEAAHKVKGSDGGVALFVVYQDLLNAAFRRRLSGNKRSLTLRYVEFLLQRCNAYLDARYSTTFGDSMYASGKTVELSPGRVLQRKLDAAVNWATLDRSPDTAKILPGTLDALLKAAAALPPGVEGVAEYVPRAFIPYVFAWGLIGDRASCPKSLARLVASQADTWQRAINPYYQHGKAKIEQIERLGEAQQAPMVRRSGIANTLAKVLFPPVGVWSALRGGSKGDGA